GRAVVGCTQPSSSEWRQRPEAFLRGEARAARELRLGASQSDQEVLPPPRVATIAAAGEDGLFADTRGTSDRRGALPAGAGTPQRIDPIGHLVEQVLMRLRADRPAAEWYGKIRPAVALDVTVPLERRNPSSYSQSRNRAPEVDRAARAPAADLATPFGDEGAQLIDCGRAVPKREPLFAPVFLSVRSAPVPDRRGPDRERRGRLRQRCGVHSAGNGGGEEARTLQHEHEVPRVEHRVPGETNRAIGAASVSREELADCVSFESLAWFPEQGDGQKVSGRRTRGCTRLCQVEKTG